MSKFDKSKIKPIVYKSDLCKLLGITYRPHYKCYIYKKYGKLNYSQKKNIHKYVINYIKQNDFDVFVNPYYQIPIWKLNTLLDFFKEENEYTINKIKNNIVTENYSNKQIYLKLNNLEEIEI